MGRSSIVIVHAGECIEEDKQIHKLVDPLVDEFWENKGRDDLYHIVYRAYRMGMRNEHIDERSESIKSLIHRELCHKEQS